MQDLEHAITRLMSLHEGDAGVMEVVSFGERAIPRLRALLFERDPSGLFQSRCRVVDALAALKAYDVLFAYLSTGRIAADPVERLGDEAVTNAAALALARVRDENVFRLLLQLGKRTFLKDVIGALGAFGRAEAIPVLIDALAEDASRLPAETAIRKLGRVAVPALVGSATLALPSVQGESESNLRRRRSSLKLLSHLRIPKSTWPKLRHLVNDADSKVAMLACGLCLASAPVADTRAAIHKLLALYSTVNWVDRGTIEEWLVAHLDVAAEVLRVYVATGATASDPWPGGEQVKRMLLRVLDRGSGQGPDGDGIKSRPDRRRRSQP